MKTRVLKAFIFSAAVCVATGFKSVHAMGHYPPPDQPKDFVVTVTAQSLLAQWTPNVNYVAFAMDGTVLSYANGSAGSLAVNKAIDMTKPHEFSLTALSIGGQSAPATYTYNPVTISTGLPSTTVVNYQFTNTASTGAPVQSYVSVTPQSTGNEQHVVNAIYPGQSVTGTLYLSATPSFTVSAAGHYDGGYPISCGPVWINSAPGINRGTLVVSFNSTNPYSGNLSCTIKQQ